jgi:hypothetical protein
LSQNVPSDGEREARFTDAAAIIPTAAEVEEREKAERDRRADNDHQLVLQLQKRQTDAQEVQAKSNKVIAGLTAALFCVSLASPFVSYLQFTAAKESADAARSAAGTADNTLRLMKSSSEETATQIERLITQQQRTATAMEQSIINAKEAMEASDRQSREALSETVRASHLVTRPWVSAGNPIIGLAPDDYVEGTLLPANFKSIDTLVPNKRFVLRVEFNDIGQTPATKVRSQGYAEPFVLYGTLTPKAISEAAEQAFRNARLQKPTENSLIAPGQRTYIISKVNPLSEVLVSSFHAEGMFIIFAGVLEYRDALGTDLHETEFCFFWTGKETSTFRYCGNPNMN